MAIATITIDAIMNLVFRAVNWANYADNTATAPQTNIGIALHTGDPGDAGDATSSETSYTGYTRINVARSTGGWTASSNGTVSPAANIDFPAGTGGTGTVGFFSTSKSNATPPAGAQPILWSGTVTPTITVGAGVTPRLTTGTTITLD